MNGVIVKALSGFYHVRTDRGDTVVCRGRGRLRHHRITPLVGDRVEITCQDDGTGAVDRVLPRINQFQRPMVANIQQMIIVASGAIPVTDPFLIDRMIAVAEWKHCQPLICFNKCDLCRMDEVAEVYRRAGFHTLQVSAETGEGMAELEAALSEKVSAFTGNSGVGKSSILNALRPELSLKVGEVSEKLGRGRHTTREVTIFEAFGGRIADTPGFASLEANRAGFIPKENLEHAFPEFGPYLGQCQFTGCSHRTEKGCAIRAALAEGKLSQTRYDSYCAMYEEVKDVKDWQRRGM